MILRWFFSWTTGAITDPTQQWVEICPTDSTYAIQAIQNDTWTEQTKTTSTWTEQTKDTKPTKPCDT